MMLYKNCRMPGAATNRAVFLWRIFKAAIACIADAVVFYLRTLKPVRNCHGLYLLREETRFYADNLETVLFDHLHSHERHYSFFYSAIIRVLEEVGSKLLERSWGKIDKLSNSPVIIQRAEREIEDIYPAREELVVFSAGETKMSYMLDLLCSPAASQGWGDTASDRRLSCAKRAVYEALLDAQSDPMNGVPEHRRASACVKALDGLERELFLSLYRENGMNIEEAYAAAQVLTAQV
jgi:hypothetical protein